MFAALVGHREVVEILVEKGDDVMSTDEVMSHKSAPHTLINVACTTLPQNGVTAVMLAVASGHLDVVQLLLDKGAIETTTDDWVVSV